MKKYLFLLNIMWVVFHIDTTCLALSPYEIPKIVAVENKMFNPRYDFSFQVSYLPLDAFYKGVGYGASYTHSFNSYLAWEVFNAQKVKTNDTHLKNDLINNFQVEPVGILDSVDGFVSSNLIYTPIYSKNLLFNKNISHGDISFVFGGGRVSFNNGPSANMYGTGIILRFYSSKLYSLKFDTRAYKHLAADKNSDIILTMGFGLSYEFGDHRPFPETESADN